jgi:hypothetical protein
MALSKGVRLGSDARWSFESRAGLPESPSAPFFAVPLWLELWSHDHALSWAANEALLAWLLVPAAISAVVLSLMRCKRYERVALSLASGFLGMVVTYITYLGWAAAQIGD